jgi:O-antigen/teichoic acid export membrane protein
MVKKHIHTLLQKGSKKVGTDLVYIAKGASWLALGQGITSIAGFAVTIVLARTFSKDEYGVYRFLLTLIPLFAVANLPSMVGAITRSVARGNFVSLPRILSVRIRYGLLGSLAALLGAGYYLFMGNTDLALSLSVVAILAPLYEVLNTYVAYLRGQERFDRSATYTAITRIVVAIATIIITFVFASPLLTAAVFIGAAIIFQGLYAWRIHKENITSQEKLPLPDDTDDVLTYGKHLSAINILGVLNDYIDRLLIWYSFGPTTLASYAIARSVPEQGIRILDIIPQIALPKISRRNWSNKKEQKKNLKKIIFLLVILLFIAFLYTEAVWMLFPILFPTYPEVILPAIILAPSIVLIPLKGIFKQILLSEKMKKIMVYTLLGDLGTFLIGFMVIIFTKTPALASLVTLVIVRMGVHVVLQVFAIIHREQTPSCP